MDRGAVYSRPDTAKYWCWYYDECGKRIRCSTGEEDETKAKVFLLARIENIARLIANPNRVSYKQAVVQFLGSIPKETTRNSYTSASRMWHPYLHTLYLDEVTGDHVRRFVMERRSAGVGSFRIKHNLAFLGSLYDHFGMKCTALGELDRKNLLKASRVEIMRILSDEDEKKLLLKLDSPYWRAMSVFAIETGLRRSEQFNLEIDQVDKEIRLRGDQCKSGKGRVVPLTPRALQALQECRDLRSSDTWCFVNPSKKPYGAPSYKWLAAARELPRPPRWHDLRHTFATRVVRMTRDIYAVSRLLGHAKIDMTTRYLHFLTDDLHERMAEFARLRGQGELDARL